MEHESSSKQLNQVIDNIGFGKFHFILLLLCGIFQACDAIEMIILAFLGPLLHCEWKISVVSQSFLTSVVFVGMLFGGSFFGKFCDLYGRKTILTFCLLLLAYTGLMSAGAPSMVWILILRGIVGACLGGMMSSLSTYLSELYPTKYRSHVILIVFGFWAFGSFFITTLCLVLVPVYGWRVFLAMSTLPLLLALPALIWLPESPRFLLLKGRKQQAVAIINRMAICNNKPIIKDLGTSSKQDFSILDLFHPNYRFTTLVCLLNWFICGLSYYSAVLVIAVINTIPKSCMQDPRLITTTTGNLPDDSCCFIISLENFKVTFISVVGEVVLLPIPLILANIIGRKPTMGLMATVIALCYFLLNFCMQQYLLEILLFVIRGFSFYLFDLNYVYASEVFPTSVRSVGVGICNGSARIGAMVAPFVVNVLMLKHSFMAGTLLLCGCNCVILVTVVLLPYETMNRKLFQTAAEDPYEANKPG